MYTEETEIWRGESIQENHVDLFPLELSMKETRTGVQSSCRRKCYLTNLQRNGFAFRPILQ